MGLDALTRLKSAGKPLSQSIATVPIEPPMIPEMAVTQADPDVIDAIAEPTQSASTTEPQPPDKTAIIEQTNPSLTDTEISKLNKETEEQIKRLADDPVTDYLGIGNVDDMSDERRRIFNDTAVRVAAMSMSQLNDEYERLFQHLKRVEMEAQSVIMIKQDRIKNAKSRSEKEKLIRENLAWEDRKKQLEKEKKNDIKIARKPKKDTVETKVTKPKGIVIDDVTEKKLALYPADIRNAAYSMIKAGISVEKVITQISAMRNIGKKS